MFPSPSEMIGIPLKITESYLEARNYGINSSLLTVNIYVILAHLAFNLPLLTFHLLDPVYSNQILKFFVQK